MVALAMKETKGETLLTPRQAAKDVLNVSVKTLRRLTAPAGPIPVVRLSSKCVRYAPSQLNEYIRLRSVGASPA
jgi:predicted site-specific integrase-resolvase